MNDLRWALRQLGNNPGFTTVAVLTLALGLGACISIFSVANAMLLRDLPYGETGRLAWFWQRDQTRGYDWQPVSGPNFLDWQRQLAGVAELAAFYSRSPDLAPRHDQAPPSPAGYGGQVVPPVRISVGRVTTNLFTLLAAPPFLGRTFLPEDEFRPVAVISHALWQSHFQSDPQVLQQSLRLNGTLFTVIGVMPPAFVFPPEPEPDQLWLPFSFAGERGAETKRGTGEYHVLARRGADAGWKSVQVALDAAMERLAREHPEANRNQGAVMHHLKNWWHHPFERIIYVLMGGTALLVLISCANVANLLLAKATARQHEMAVRVALGASRFLIVRQLLVESLVLALAGGAVGLGLGFGGTALFAATIPQHNYRVGAIEVDAMVMIFAAVLSLTTGLLFGLAPAFTAWRDDVVAALKEGGRQSDGRSSQGMRRGLVVTQVALAVVLLTGAFITAGQFREMLRARWGFQTERLLVAPLPLPLDRYTNAARFVSFQEQLRARLRALPGVEAAAISTALPLAGERDTAREFQIEGPSVALRAMAGGRPAFPGTEGRGGPVAWLEWISPDYFETLGVPRLSGRDFNAAEVSTGGNVALINRHLAENYFQNQNPVGRRLRLLAPASGQAGPKQEQLLEIIGVTGDVRHGYPTEKARPWVYLPYAQNPDWNIALAVRTTLAPETVAGAVRAAVAALDPQLPAVSVRTMPSYIRQSMADERVQTVLWTLFAAAALMLAVIGLYGLLSFTVAHGTRDLAIRMALGASRGCVLRQVMFGGMQLTAAGLGLGLTISWIGWRLVSSYWFIAAPLEAWPVASVMVTLPLAALVACIFPARRATRIQPAEALRRG